MTARIGWMGWMALAVLALGAALYGAWRYALATNAVALLDWGDRQFGPSGGYRVALKDGRYGRDPAQRVEVIVPAAEPDPAGRPVMVFFHGGGWDSGSPGDYHFIGRTFARAGYVVVVPGYRLVPRARFPAMLEDGASAITWARAHAAELGGDPDRMVLIGHSAGAYNAVMLALERQWLGRAGVPEGAVKAVVGLSGPYDFYPWTNDSARAAFGQWPDPQATQPIHHVRGDAPPMLLLTGSEDTTVKPRNSRVLGKALNAAGARAEVVVLDGIDHAGTVMRLAAPFSRSRVVVDPVLSFLARHGAASAPVQPRES